jgi:hypothetical protein
MSPNVNVDRSFALHCRSLDRTNGDTSDYDIYLKTPIECPPNCYLIATLTRADIPNSFYTIDTNHNTISVDCLPEVGSYLAGTQAAVLTGSYFSAANKLLYRKTITLHGGNYTINELRDEIVRLLNAAYAATVRSYLRGKTAANGGSATEQAQNTADRALVSGLTIASDANGYDYVVVKPQFAGTVSSTRNKLTLQRTDGARQLSLSQFTMTAFGNRLLMALGFNHHTAQTLIQFQQAGTLATSEKTQLFSHNSITSQYTFGATELNGFPTTTTQTIFPPNIINVHAEDTVYIRSPDLGTNGYETLYGNMTNVLGVVPMTGQGHALVFHNPVIPFPVNVKSGLVDHMHVQLTDANGMPFNFNGAEHEFSLTFECYLKGTRPKNRGMPDDDVGVQQTILKDPHRRRDATLAKSQPRGNAPSIAINNRGFRSVKN